MARLLLGVSGGVAAYKALLTARLAVKRGHAVRVIQTPASLKFIGAASFEVCGPKGRCLRMRCRSLAAPSP